MAISDVKDVSIALKDSYKFIVAIVSDGMGGEKMVIRAEKYEDCELHHDILCLLQQEVRPGGLKAHCIGGGRIQVNSEVKTIRIWDDSAAHGKEPNRQETVRMLQVEFPEFQVTAS